MNLVLSGASGFIGSALCSRLQDKGHSLTLLTRFAPREAGSKTKKWHHWTPGTPGEWENVLEGADGVINLSGEPIAAQRWTGTQKHRIRWSRLQTTGSLVEAMQKTQRKPAFLLNASAVGYYGPRGDEAITEAAAPGKDFLSTVCREWEQEAMKAEPLGIRVIRLRTGIVLGKNGGALAKMADPFRFYVGGPLGTGQQWMSWIHLEDQIGLMIHLIENSKASGAVNATAPNPVRMKEFCQILGQVMGRPSWLPVPAFGLRLLLGELAEMLLTGQRVLPEVASQLGYQFRYVNLENALRACIPI
jgi:uncharacterized protein (TIGR01777 family)